MRVVHIPDPMLRCSPITSHITGPPWGSKGMSWPHVSEHGRAYSGLGLLGVDLHGALIVLINYKKSNVICIITNACAGSLDKSCMRLSEKCVMQKNV